MNVSTHKTQSILESGGHTYSVSPFVKWQSNINNNKQSEVKYRLLICLWLWYLSCPVYEILSEKGREVIWGISGLVQSAIKLCLMLLAFSQRL